MTNFGNLRNKMHIPTYKVNIDYTHAVNKATERNIVVYDEGARRFTRRLIAIMKTVQRRSAGSELSHIILPAEGFYDLAVELNITHGKMYTQLFGVHIQGTYDMGFNDKGGLIDYFLNHLNGHLPNGKEEIVIGLAQKEKDEEKRYLLGSY